MADHWSHDGEVGVLPSQSNDGKKDSLAAQVLPPRASARAASDAIRKSFYEKYPLQVPTHHEPSDTSLGQSGKLLEKMKLKDCTINLERIDDDKRSESRVKHTAKTKHRLKRCSIKLQHIENDPKFRAALLAKYGKDVKKMIADGTVCLKVALSSLPKQFSGGGRGISAGMATKQIKVDGSFKLPPGYKVVSATKSIPSAAANGNVKFVVVGPKPGSQIVNPGKPAMMPATSALSHILTQKNTTYRTVSSVKEMFQCELCSVGCASMRNLVNHKRLAHKHQNFMCYGCGKGFVTSSELNYHECEPLRPVPVENTKSMTTSSRSLYAVFPNKSQLLITKSHVVPTQSPVRYASASMGLQALAQKASGTCTVETSTETVKTQEIVIAEPGGKYTSLNREVVHPHKPGPSQASASSKGTEVGTSAGPWPMNYECANCFLMFPSGAALASHTCLAALPVPPAATVSPSPPVITTEPVPVEVEQLAKFYSSMVFKQF